MQVLGACLFLNQVDANILTQTTRITELSIQVSKTLKVKSLLVPIAKGEERKYSGKGRSGRASSDGRGNVLLQEKERED